MTYTKPDLVWFKSRLKTKCNTINIGNSQQTTVEFNLSSV